MAWLISRSLMEDYENSRCSPVPVEASSADTYSDGTPSAQSSGSPIPLAFCAPDKMTAFSRLSRFGTTFKPLTADLGADLLTWFLAAFPAKTSPRVASGTRARVDRLKAIGNGQVPLCAATAWRLLTK